MASKRPEGAEAGQRESWGPMRVSDVGDVVQKVGGALFIQAIEGGHQQA